MEESRQSKNVVFQLNQSVFEVLIFFGCVGGNIDRENFFLSYLGGSEAAGLCKELGIVETVLTDIVIVIAAKFDSDVDDVFLERYSHDVNLLTCSVSNLICT